MSRSARDGTGSRVKKRQEKANIKRRWAGDTAISGAGRKKSAHLRRLKKELAKRSLRLMCREEARAWKRRFTCLRFIPRVERCCWTLVVPRQDASRMRRTTVLRRDVSSCWSYLFCVVTSDFWVQKKMKRLIVKMESAAKKLLFFSLYSNVFVDPLNNELVIIHRNWIS